MLLYNTENSFILFLFLKLPLLFNTQMINCSNQIYNYIFRYVVFHKKVFLSVGNATVHDPNQTIVSATVCFRKTALSATCVLRDG